MTTIKYTIATAGCTMLTMFTMQVIIHNVGEKNGLHITNLYNVHHYSIELFYYLLVIIHPANS